MPPPSAKSGPSCHVHPLPHTSRALQAKGDVSCRVALLTEVHRVPSQHSSRRLLRAITVRFFVFLSAMAMPPAATEFSDRICHNLDCERGLVRLAVLCFVLAGGVQGSPTSCGSSYALIEGGRIQGPKPPTSINTNRQPIRTRFQF